MASYSKPVILTQCFFSTVLSCPSTLWILSKASRFDLPGCFFSAGMDAHTPGGERTIITLLLTFVDLTSVTLIVLMLMYTSFYTLLYFLYNTLLTHESVLTPSVYKTLSLSLSVLHFGERTRMKLTV